MLIGRRWNLFTRCPLLLSPDTGAGSGGGGQASGAGAVGDTAGSSNAGSTGGSGAGDQTQAGDGTGTGASGTPELTDEQRAAVNAEVARQLGAAVRPKLDAERQKWEADLKALAEAENQTAEERARSEAEQARREADEVIAKANERLVAAVAREVALDAKANPARVDALLRLADLSDVTVGDDGQVDRKAAAAAVTKALDEYPEFRAGATAATNGASGGDFNGTSRQGQPKDLSEAIAAHYAAK